MSDAHAAVFASHGAVAVRGALAELRGDDARLVGAAALAARLLDAPAVWRAVHDGFHRVVVVGASDDDGELADRADALVQCAAEASSSRADGASTGAVRAALGDPVDLAADDALVLSAGVTSRAVLSHSPAVQTFAFAASPPRGAMSAAPVWRDSLHGKRGRTPTTVVEWSKGPPAAGEVHQPPPPRV